MKKIKEVRFNNSLQIYAFGAIAVALVLGMILILQSFWVSMFLGVMFAYLLQPMYAWFLRKKHIGKKLSVLIVTLIFTVIIFTPIVIFLYVIWSEISDLARQMSEFFSSAESKDQIETLVDFINNKFGEGSTSIEEVTKFITGAGQSIASLFLGFIGTIASTAINAFTTVVVFYAVFVSLLPIRGEIRKLIYSVSPFEDAVTFLYTHRTGLITRDMVIGTLVVGAGYAIGVGGLFYILGIPFWAFAGFAAFLLSFLPLIGPSLITVPVAILIGLNGDWAVAIAIILFHFLVLNNLEIFVRPLIVSEDARVNPVLMILALLGGLATFGFMGVFYGPIILVLAVTTLEVFIKVLEEYKKGGSIKKKVA